MLGSIACASPPQLAIAEFLANGGYDHYLRSIRRVYARQTAQMGDAIGRSFPEGTRVSRPQGSFVLWVEMPEGVDSILLYRRAKGQGIAIAPGSIFSVDGKYRNCIRLNAACWTPAVEVAIDTLGRLATEQLNLSSR